MKVLRFMSLAEFEKYRAGEILTNETKHQAYTDAQGFCFLNADDYEPQYAYEFLSGIVSSEICAIFECKDVFNHGSGRYADPYGSFWQSMSVDELCTTEYSHKQLKLLQYCDDFADKYDGESFKRKFDFKTADAPVRRRINVVDKNPPAAPSRYRSNKLDPEEQKLLDAIKAYLMAKNTGIPTDMFDGFTLGDAPTLSYERDFSRDTLRIEGLTFIRQGTLQEFHL